MFRKLFCFLNFSRWHLVICYDPNSKELLISRSHVSGFIQMMCTVWWWGSTWKPPSVFALDHDLLPQLSSLSSISLYACPYCFLSCSILMCSSLSCSNKQPTLSESHTALGTVLFYSYSKTSEEPSCALFLFFFSAPPPPSFFFSLLKSDFSSYCFCETTLTKIRGGILIVKSSGHFSVHLLFHLSLALDIDSCSLLSKLSLF